MFDINGRFRAPTQNLLYLDRERPPRRRCVTMLSHTTFHGAIPYGYMVEGREFLPLPRSARLHACNQLPRAARLCCCSTTPKSPPALPSDADRLTVKCACAPALAGCMLVTHNGAWSARMSSIQVRIRPRTHSRTGVCVEPLPKAFTKPACLKTLCECSRRQRL